MGWVKSANVHYTLRFLGDLEPAGVEAASAPPCARRPATKPFKVALGARASSPTRGGRAVLAGRERGRAGADRLSRVLETALMTEGFGRADKPFAPHLTLGRVRDTADGRVASRFLAGTYPADGFECGNWWS